MQVECFSQENRSRDWYLVKMRCGHPQVVSYIDLKIIIDDDDDDDDDDDLNGYARSNIIVDCMTNL